MVVFCQRRSLQYALFLVGRFTLVFIDEGLEAAPGVAVEHFLLASINVVAAEGLGEPDR